MEEFLIPNSDGRLFLLDTNIDTRPFKRFADRTFTTSCVDKEKHGYFENTLSHEHILNSYTREEFKKVGGTLTISALGEEMMLAYNTRANTTSCDSCGAPTTSTLTNSAGNEFYVCQKLSVADFGLLVLTTALPRLLLVTDECCLGWSSATTGSVSLHKQVKWYNYYK